MSLDRALQLNTAALAVLGALFLAFGHESTFAPALLAVAAVVAVGLTDVLHWLRLNRIVANGIALLAVAWSLHDFFNKGSGDQLLAIANMLVCLQVVLLFQEKTARVYWQLTVLSLLQVVVAAALDLGPQFGALLFLYVVLALCSLVLLCIYRVSRPEPPLRRIREWWSAGGTNPSGSASDKTEGWRKLLAPPVAGPITITAEEFSRQIPAGIIARQVAVLTAATLAFTTVFFYITPRLSEGTWQGPKGKGGVMGFAPEVRLEQAGRIQLNQQVVMRASLSRLVDRRPVQLVGEPYFQGTALTEYVCDERGCRWVARRAPRRPRSPLETATNLVRQDIVVETAHAALMAMWPIQPVKGTPDDLRINRSMYRISRGESDGIPLGRQFRYAFGTPAVRSNRQLHAVPHPNLVYTLDEYHQLYAELKVALAFDQQRFPRLAETAAAVLLEQGLEDSSPLQKALALERHFRVPESYHYSLDLDVARDRNLDPIEDFVANHRSGHCEYFASALVMMLRSQGIPARMVAGFKGGDYNSLGQYYIVQQRHAHSWVEVWLPPGEVPDWEIAGSPTNGGSWYRLDPTPPERESLTATDEEGIGRRLAQAFDYVELLWRDYVLSLNSTRQQDSLYDPLTEHAATFPAWTGGRSFQRWLRRWSRRLGIELPLTRERGHRVFETELALVVAGGLLAVFLLVQGDRFLRRYARWWLGRTAAAGQRTKAPAFYRRLERLLIRAGLSRREGQTAQELAAVAEQRLAGSNGRPGVAKLPARIVEAYYRVRFGGGRLDRQESEAIEHALVALGPAFKQAKRHRNRQ